MRAGTAVSRGGRKREKILGLLSAGKKPKQIAHYARATLSWVYVVRKEAQSSLKRANGRRRRAA